MKSYLILGLALFLAVLTVCLADKTTTQNTTTTTKVTTPPPTTTTPAPNTTTHAPPVTTVPPVPTTPPPLPEPNSTVYYNLTAKDGHSCLLASFAATFRFNYEDTYNRSVTVGINVPEDAEIDTAKSSCGPNNGSVEVLVLNWDRNVLTLTFNSSSKEAWLESVSLSYLFDNKTFPSYNQTHVKYNQTFTISSGILDDFHVSKGHTYRCDSEVTRTLKGDANAIPAELELRYVRVDPFRSNSTKPEFEKELVCQADKHVSDVVPIAVGCALAGLVVIVLIAYFIGRRRSRRLAYQSV